jgi:hypothetical protein
MMYSFLLFYIIGPASNPSNLSQSLLGLLVLLALHRRFLLVLCAALLAGCLLKFRGLSPERSHSLSEQPGLELEGFQRLVPLGRNLLVDSARLPWSCPCILKCNPTKVSCRSSFNLICGREVRLQGCKIHFSTMHR